MASPILGYVQAFESLTALDGAGVRAMIFMHGCPLRCLFCSNPEMWATKKGDSISSRDLLQQVSRLVPYIQGISVSGGEPLGQPEFVADVMKGAHELNLETCLDTSGAGSAHAWAKVLPHTDHALFCIKSFDPVMYTKITGRSQHRALQFANELAFRNIPYNLRYVVIPGMTDRPQDIQSLIDFSKEQPTLKRVELLPYHKLGLGKWKQLRLSCPLADTDTPKSETIREIVDSVRNAGIEVLI